MSWLARILDRKATHCRSLRAGQSNLKASRLHSHLCDVCSHITIHEPEGYCLITAQIVSCPAYWERPLQMIIGLEGNNCSEKDLIMTVLPMVQMCADSPTPWVVCENCIRMFSVDCEQTHEYAVRWWRSGKKFEPPGNGPVPANEVQLPTDKYQWAEAVNAAIWHAVRIETVR